MFSEYDDTQFSLWFPNRQGERIVCTICNEAKNELLHGSDFFISEIISTKNNRGNHRFTVGLSSVGSVLGNRRDHRKVSAGYRFSDTLPIKVDYKFLRQ